MKMRSLNLRFLPKQPARIFLPVRFWFFLLLISFTSGFAADSDLERIWSLPEAIEFAFENNPDVRLMRERLHAARAELERAEAVYLPTVSIGSSYEGSSSSGRAFGWILNQRSFDSGLDFNRPGTTDNWNLHGMVRQSLFDGGRRSGIRDAAGARVGSEKARNEAVRQEVAFALVRTFLEIRKADQIVRGFEAEFEALRVAIDAGEARLERGALLESDLLYLQVSQLRVEEELVQSRHAASLARLAFVHLLGLSYREGVEVGYENLSKLFEVPEAEVVDRAELEAVQQDRKVREGEVRAARAGKKPRIDLYGRVDRDHGWQTGGSGEHWSAGIALTFDVWDGGEVSSEIRSAEARRREAIEAERKIELLIDEELERARLAMEKSELRLRVGEKALRLADENVRQARVRFEKGALLSTQLSEAESALTEARVRYAVAEADADLSKADYRRALGVFPIEDAK